MTEEENAVFNLLGEAANSFSKLPVLHPSDKSEFVLAIHAAQNIVLARQSFKQYWDEINAKKADAEPSPRV